MVDGTGMCGCCRLTIGGEVKITCVDGPEFDGHLVDWDTLLLRQKIYLNAEKHAAEHYQEKKCPGACLEALEKNG
jgi:ferredoxin--NADP+ reductase